jgi:alpha-N-arabinofuranosidase
LISIEYRNQKTLSYAKQDKSFPMVLMKSSVYIFIITFGVILTCQVNAANISPARIIHVSKTGNDSNNGSLIQPLLTITKASMLALPGDRIVVHKGTYREMIVLPSGGNTNGSRIIYEAAPGEDIFVKGSERIKTWTHIRGHTWRVEIDESFFNGSNPFAKQINKDSSYQHLGEVYLSSNPLKEQKSVNEIDKIPNTWFASQENNKTIITANFGTNDPNIKLTEINVRSAAFTAVKAGVSYITLSGFKISQVASPMAFINGEQSGAISSNGGSHWVIQNCVLNDCKSVAIAIGQTGHAYPGASPSKPEYSDLTQDTAGVGHDIIKHNHIFRCGQAGIFGLLHGCFSEITDNLIEDINGNNEYPSNETAGVHLALAIDAVINHNLIRNSAGYGFFLGPLLQNSRISRNIVTNVNQSCIYFYNSHGPVLIDNNILSGSGKSSNQSVKMISAEANVFVQNLFFNCGFVNAKVPGRSFATSNFLPHSLVIKQTIPALPMDDRWYANVFIKDGLDQLNVCPDCEVNYNVYCDGADVIPGGDQKSIKANGSSHFKLINSPSGVSMVMDSKWTTTVACPPLTAEFIGFFALSKMYLSYPDGRPINVDKDFDGRQSNHLHKLAGPFYEYKSGSRQQLLFTY